MENVENSKRMLLINPYVTSKSSNCFLTEPLELLSLATYLQYYNVKILDLLRH